jgi:hypothetical protein
MTDQHETNHDKTNRYDRPNAAARAVNHVFRVLAEAGVSIAGTHALRIRGRTSGKVRSVVVNLLSIDGRQFLVSPRGDTQWARNARAAGQAEVGPRWHGRVVRVEELADDAKPEILRTYVPSRLPSRCSSWCRRHRSVRTRPAAFARWSPRWPE